MFWSDLSLSRFMSNPQELHWQVAKWLRKNSKGPWLWNSISGIYWLHDSRAYWFELGWMSWYKEVRNRLCVHSWFRKAISWQSKLSTHTAWNYEQQTRNVNLSMLCLSSINWKKKSWWSRYRDPICYVIQTLKPIS